MWNWINKNETKKKQELRSQLSCDHDSMLARKCIKLSCWFISFIYFAVVYFFLLTHKKYAILLILSKVFFYADIINRECTFHVLVQCVM